MTTQTPLVLVVDPIYLVRVERLGAGCQTPARAELRRVPPGRRHSHRAAIDVLAAESPPTEHPLWIQAYVSLSPHVAGVTENWTKCLARACAGNIDAIVSGERPAKLLNSEILS